MAGDKSLPWKHAEADREERRDQELLQRQEHERQPHFLAMIWVGERGKRSWSRFQCHVLRTVPSVHSHSSVRAVHALRTCPVKRGIQPGKVVPAQRSWSPVRLLGSG